MTSNEAIVRAAYRTAEGDVQDLEGWRNAFTEDGVFNNIAAGESYTGDRLGDVVTYMASLLPDVHRQPTSSTCGTARSRRSTATSR